MPKVKSKSVSRLDGGSDEEYEVGTQSLTQAEKVARAMSEDEMKRKVNQFVQYVLIADQKKIPIKRQDLTKHVLKEHSKAFPKILEKAREVLRDVFGFDMQEIPNSKVTRYILTNNIDLDPDKEHLEWSQAETQKIGLLTLVLTAIFMKGNCIADSELYAMLKILGVDIDGTHDDFDNVRHLLTKEFPQQLYLEYERVPKSDPPEFTYRWGPRAELEVSKRCVLDLASKVYGVEPKGWTAQYKQVCEQEGAPADDAAEQGHADVDGDENMVPEPQTSRGTGKKKQGKSSR